MPANTGRPTRRRVRDAVFRNGAGGHARAAAVGAGWRAEGLVLLGYRGTATLFNQRETVEFLVQGAQPPKTVRVELHKPVYFLGWQVVDVREEAQAGPR